MSLGTEALASSLVVIKKNGDDGQRYVLTERKWCILGSHSECDIRIHSSGVGALHALFIDEDGARKLFGLCNEVPVMIPGRQKILYKNDGAKLESGDVFFLAERAFRLEMVPQGGMASQTDTDESQNIQDKENVEKTNTPLNKVVVRKKGAVTTPSRKKSKKASRRHSLVVSDRDEVFVFAAKSTTCIPKDRFSVPVKEIAAAFAADSSTANEDISSAPNMSGGQAGGIKFNLDYRSGESSKAALIEKIPAPKSAQKDPPLSRQSLVPQPVEKNQEHDDLVKPSTEYLTPRRAQRVPPANSNVFQRSAQRVGTPKRNLESSSIANSSTRRSEKLLQCATPQRSTPSARGIYVSTADGIPHPEFDTGPEMTPSRNPKGTFPGTPKRVPMVVEETAVRAAAPVSFKPKTPLRTPSRKPPLSKGTPSRSVLSRGTPSRTPLKNATPKYSGKMSGSDMPLRSPAKISTHRMTPGEVRPSSILGSNPMGNSSELVRSMGTSGAPSSAIQMPEASRAQAVPPESFTKNTTASVALPTTQPQSMDVPCLGQDVITSRETTIANSEGDEGLQKPASVESKHPPVGLTIVNNHEEAENLESTSDAFGTKNSGNVEKDSPVPLETQSSGASEKSLHLAVPKLLDTSETEKLDARETNSSHASDARSSDTMETGGSGASDAMVPDEMEIEVSEASAPKVSDAVETKSSGFADTKMFNASGSKTLHDSETLGTNSTSKQRVPKASPSKGHVTPSLREAASSSRNINGAGSLSSKKSMAFARLSAGLSALPKATRQESPAPQINIDVNALQGSNAADTVRKLFAATDNHMESDIPSEVKRSVLRNTQAGVIRKQSSNITTPARRRPVKQALSGLPPRPSPKSRRVPLSATKSIQKSGRQKLPPRAMSERKRGVLFNPMIELEAGSHYSPSQATSGKSRKRFTDDNTSRKLDMDMLPKPSPPGKTKRPLPGRFLGPPPSSPLARLGRFLYPRGPSVPLLMAPASNGSDMDEDVTTPKSESLEDNPIPEEADDQEEAPSNRRSSIGASVSNFLKRLSGAFNDEDETGENDQDSSRGTASPKQPSAENKSADSSESSAQSAESQETENDSESGPIVPSKLPEGSETAPDSLTPEEPNTQEPHTPKPKKRLSIGMAVVRAASVVAEAISPGGGLFYSHEESEDSMEVDDESAPSKSNLAGPELCPNVQDARMSISPKGSGMKRIASKKGTGSVSNRRKLSVDSLPFDSSEMGQAASYKEDPQARDTDPNFKPASTGAMNTDIQDMYMNNTEAPVEKTTEGLSDKDLSIPQCEEDTPKSAVLGSSDNLVKFEPSSETDSDSDEIMEYDDQLPRSTSEAAGLDEKDQNKADKDCTNSSTRHDNSNADLNNSTGQTAEPIGTEDAASEESDAINKDNPPLANGQDDSAAGIEKNSSDPNYATWTVKQLQEFLRGLDVQCNGMRKAELITTIEKICSSRNEAEIETRTEETVKTDDDDDDVDDVQGPQDSNPKTTVAEKKEDSLKDLLEKMKVSELRERLETMGLDTKGRKSELIDRIIGRSESTVVHESSLYDPNEPVEDLTAADGTDVTESYSSPEDNTEQEDSKSALLGLKVPELREKLESLGLDSKGKKIELVERLYEASKSTAEPEDSGSKMVPNNSTSTESEESPEEDNSEPTQRAKLEAMTVLELRAKLASLGLNSRGRKIALIDRLEEAETKSANGSTSPVAPAQSDDEISDAVVTDNEKETNDREEYMAMTVKELRKLVVKRGLEATPKLRKAELVEYILKMAHNTENDGTARYPTRRS